MAPFSKPETVLKQAEGLVSVGQSHAALQSLTEMFSSKRFRSTPLTSLEPIMLRFVELCVDMRKGRTAKEGLMQYKNIAQNTSVASIENVIKRFVSLADAKVQEAQQKAERVLVEALVDVDDLEASETPESILLGAVSGDQNKDRTDRALVTPWLKFLWESYRTALETLKNNARLEGIYQQIAQQAFKFCLKHQRKVEFRRLCETLRLHLSNVAKYSHQPHSINLGDADTLQHHLDTRFAQLNTSVELELWQEAFRSVEDIHNLLNMAKKAPRPAMMANYYEKLTRIFLTSGNALFHAAAWARYYGIVRTVGGKSEEELSRLAGQVLISALAVPVGHASEEDEVKGRTTRLAALLGLTKTPTRTGLLKEALSRNVLKLAPQVVKDLYEILEVTFDPLSLCSNVVPLLKALSSDASYASYLPLLQRALLSRLLAQLAQVYSTMEVSKLLKLVEPLQGSFEGAYEPNQVEGFLIACARSGDLRVRIDHAEGTLTFIDEAFGGAPPGPISASGAGLDKSVQPSAHDLVRTRLSSVATCLCNSLSAIDPPSPTLTESESQEKFAQLVSAANAERKALQVRRAIVARRRELISELSVRKEKEEASRRAEANRREKDEAARRALEDIRRKQEERIRKDRENFDKEEARKLAQELKEKNILKVDVDELGEVNKDDLVRLQVQQIEKEKKDQHERLRIIAKRLDHLERAFRKEERPLLAKDYEQQQIDDRRAFEEAQKSRLEAARLTHQQDLDTKRRLMKMRDEYEKRKEVYIAKRGEEFAKRRAEATRKVEEEKLKRRNAVLKAREEERKREEEEERIRLEKEEEERRLEEERLAEEKRIAEEEEATKAEEEKRKTEEEERKAELRKQRDQERRDTEEKAKLQRQREAEAEAKLLARRQAAVGGGGPGGREGKEGRGESPAGAWRRTTPGTPTMASTALPSRQATATPPPQSEGGQTQPVSKYVPGALRGRGGAPGGGGWRDREKARQEASATGGGGAAAGGTKTPERPASPAVVAKDEDGFQPATRNVWRPSRGTWSSKR